MARKRSSKKSRSKRRSTRKGMVRRKSRKVKRKSRKVKRKSRKVKRKSRSIKRKVKRKIKRKSKSIKRKVKRKSKSIKRKIKRKSKSIKRKVKRKSKSIKRKVKRKSKSIKRKVKSKSQSSSGSNMTVKLKILANDFEDYDYVPLSKIPEEIKEKMIAQIKTKEFQKFIYDVILDMEYWPPDIFYGRNIPKPKLLKVKINEDNTIISFDMEVYVPKNEVKKLKDAIKNNINTGADGWGEGGGHMVPGTKFEFWFVSDF